MDFILINFFLDVILWWELGERDELRDWVFLIKGVSIFKGRVEFSVLEVNIID